MSALKYKLIEVESIYGCMHPKDSYGAPHGNVIHEDSYGPPHAEPIHKGGPLLRLSLHENKSINTWNVSTGTYPAWFDNTAHMLGKLHWLHHTPGQETYGAPIGNVIHTDSYGPPKGEPVHKGGRAFSEASIPKHNINILHYLGIDAT